VLQKIKDFYEEFKPAILFLVRFSITFAILSLVYGFWIEGYKQIADPITKNVSYQVREILSWFYDNVTSTQREGNPSMDITIDGKYSVSVFEGCNGVAIVNLFFSFLVGFWGGFKKLVWFTLVGIVIIHIANLGRLLSLALMAISLEEGSKIYHYTHKYLFTLFIYSIIFVLWYFWVTKVNPIAKQKPKATTDEPA
jgi:exosortase family protein XrtF